MKTSKLLGSLVTAAVGVVVVTGFFLAGSPAEERARRFDTQRVNDLQMITNAVDTFYNAQKRLPSSLEEMRNQPNIYLQTNADPTTGVAYEYRAVDQKNYEICATFETDASKNNDMSGKYAPVPVGVANPPNYWAHTQGRTCYTVKANDWNVKQ